MSSLEKYAVKDYRGRTSTPANDAELFEVVGAGYLAIHPHTTARCGSAVGLSLDCSWGKWGYAGGVLDVSEVRRLRDSLDAWLAERAG